jgi:hypothetical protein
MSLESAVRAMLTAGTTINLVPDARITHGYRLQDTALPAITFEVAQYTVEGIGSSPISRFDIEVRCVAEATVDALAIAAQVRTACVAGTYDGIVFSAVIDTGGSADAATTADGDESLPAEYAQTFTIYYTE